MGYQWTGKLILTETLEKKYVKMAADNCDQPGVKPFLLCVEIDRTSSVLVNIYGQYWIINKTNLPLSIGVRKNKMTSFFLSFYVYKKLKIENKRNTL